MKVLFSFLLSFIGVIAQDNWKVSLDKKVLLNASEENEAKNVINISPADLKTKKTFVLNYKEAAPQKGWERTISIYDEKDNELKKQKGKSLTLKVSELKSLLNKFKTIKIYTTSLPTDPKIKAQIRVRRVHLCTLILQE
jgi:hypothetical protein